MTAVEGNGVRGALLDTEVSDGEDAVGARVVGDRDESSQVLALVSEAVLNVGTREQAIHTPSAPAPE